MDLKKQGTKKDHVVIVTSEAEGASVKKFKVKGWVINCAVICACILIGGMSGYIIYEERIWEAANAKIDTYKDMVAELENRLAEANAQTEEAAIQQEELIKSYENDIAVLNDKMTILSETINAKSAEVEELTAQKESLYSPTLLPLTGSATIEITDDEEPACIFYATEGALVVATANGTITELVEETEGYRMVIDHGNGYVTIYRNQGTPKVKAGDEVRQGATLFIVGEQNTKLTYQIVKDDIYMDPMEVMQISG